jgi:hypothetical protein
MGYDPPSTIGNMTYVRGSSDLNRVITHRLLSIIQSISEIYQLCIFDY